ncbi:hypothetical protein LRR80_03846 [Streptomyces sp. RO-S4]|uniref:hypothetical protein n=1 Tax=unclassified Streptomyces TaxID=2593676 RepID=UPI001E4C2CD3|nr:MULTISPECIES: hypothetical protein [unclassified Streptomyces]MCO4697778.1 hypothetical protein [Streptomyces sp. RO-S4]
MGFASSLVCAIAVLISAARAAAMALPGRPQPWPDHLLRRSTATLGWAAGAVYALGLAGVAWAEAEVGDGADSTPAPACRFDFNPETVEGLSHHRASYLPLRFDCVREDGSVYVSDPDLVWLNWTSAALALTAALLFLGMHYRTKLRARRVAVR